MTTTTLPRFAAPVILTAGMLDASGRRMYGVFASEEDARAMDADQRTLAVLGEADLTEEQRQLAAANSEAL